MRTTLLYIMILLLWPMVMVGQTRRNSVYENYIQRYKDIAIEQMLHHNIPASITLAQGLLESGAGRSTLAQKGNNHFGIKCHGWTGKSMHKDDDKSNECFRVYRSARESYEDHSNFLQRKRYAKLFSLDRTDYRGWAYGLKECGYATNPQYAQRLITLIETYGLQDYDRATKYDSFMAKHESKKVNGVAGREHSISYNNDNYFVVARDGETFEQIGKEFDVSARKLANYNERDKRDVLSAGDIVYLKKKRSKADSRFKNQPHVVLEGESMYDIAQKYGMRLKNLYKINKLDADHVAQVGERLKVR